MIDASFFTIVGYVTVGGITIFLILLSTLWFWVNLIHGRFNLIFFRKSKRRLSIASWHESVLLDLDGNFDENSWLADDHVIGPNPFFISYQIGNRRLFLMAGTLHDWRGSNIKGKHP